MKCAVCEDREMQYVCHHCGKPICGDSKCSHTITDPVFSTDEKPIAARHCLHCLEDFHPAEAKNRANK